MAQSSPRYSRQLTKDKSRVQSPVVTKIKKMKGGGKLVAVNIEIQHNVLRGEGCASEITSLPGKKAREPQTHILCVGG